MKTILKERIIKKKASKKIYKNRPAADVSAAKNIEAGMSVELTRKLRGQEIDALKEKYRK